MTNQEKRELANLLYELVWNTRRLRDHYQESESLRETLKREADNGEAWADRLRSEANNG